MHGMMMGDVCAPSKINNIGSSGRCVVRFQAACLEAGVSVSTMRRLIKAGHGPRLLQLSARCIGVRRSDLDEWLIGRTR